MGRRRMSLEEVKLASMAKRANQRLRQLEFSGLVDSPAYKYVMKLPQLERQENVKILGRTRDNQIKFRTDITKMSKFEQNEYRYFLEAFAKSELSTVKGFKAYTKDTMDLVARLTKKEPTTEDYNRIWATGIASMMKRIYGSGKVEMVVDASSHANLSVNELEAILLDRSGDLPVEIINHIEDLSEMATTEKTEGRTSPPNWKSIFGGANMR